MKKKKSVLEKLSSKEIEEITSTAKKKKNVPLIKSQQVNMRLDSDHLEKARQPPYSGQNPSKIRQRFHIHNLNHS